MISARGRLGLRNGFWKFAWNFRTPELRRIRGQLGDASTSVGANYEEAEGALTKKDTRKSVVVARKEAREYRFFLKVISGTYLPPEEVEPEIKESTELIHIFSSIIDKLS